MDYYTDYDSVFSSLLSGIGALLIILLILLFAFVVVIIIANWKMYKKAGKGGWECIVPVYGYWVLTEIAGLEWWWFLLAIVDSIVSILGIDNLSTVANLVSLFASFNIYYNIAIKFNKNKGTAVCAGIFSPIFVLIFGFSKSEVYDANIPVSKNGVFGTPEANFNNNNNGYAQNNTTQPTENVDINNVNQAHSFCKICGTKLNKDIKFCPNCGKENI